jgi:hypothetical protein
MCVIKHRYSDLGASSGGFSDVIAGYLEVGTNGHGSIIVNHPNLETDENGIGHLVFSPNQARNLAKLLNKKATEAESER